MIIQKKHLYLVFLGFFILVFTHFFSFKSLNVQIYKGLEFLMLLLLFVIIINGKRFRIKKNFKNFAYLFMILPLISIIPAYLSRDQDFLLSIYMLRYELIWLLYFVLHSLNLTQKDIIKLVSILAIVFVVISILQQFSYPRYWFYTRGDSRLLGTKIEIRMGIYRYMIAGIDIVILAFYMYYQKFISNIKLFGKPALYSFLFLIGIYLFMTRQLLFAIVINILLSFLLLKSGKQKFIAFFSIGLIAMVVIYNSEQLFGELIADTQNDSLNDNYVRYKSYDFFLNDYWNGIDTVLFGNGPEHKSSRYGQDIQRLKEYKGFYRSDIGIIGTINKYGVLYGLTFLYLLFFTYFKFRKKLEVYQKQFLLHTFLLLIMIFPLSQTFGTVIFVIYLYLVDLSIHFNTKENIKKNNTFN